MGLRLKQGGPKSGSCKVPKSGGGLHLEVAHGLQGRERVSSVLGSLPQLLDSDSWDGGEGSAQEEEEFSLEDLMADDKEEL